MAFRMIGASNRETLTRKKLEKKELGPIESFQAEVLAQTDAIDAQFPPESQIISPSSMIPEGGAPLEAQIASAASDSDHQLDAQIGPDILEAEIDAVPLAEDPATNTVTLPSPPLTRTRKLKKLAASGEVAESEAPKKKTKLLGDAISAAVPRKKVIPQSIVVPEHAMEITDVTSPKSKASHSPVHEETATGEAPLLAEPLAMRFPVSGRIIHRPDSPDSSKAISVEEPDSRGHDQEIDLTQSPSNETVPSPHDPPIDLDENAPTSPESVHEETTSAPQAQDKGKAPIIEDEGSPPKVFLPEDGHPISGAGESSRPKNDESYDPEKPADWPYDHPSVAELAAFHFAGFAGFHQHPVPSGKELKKLIAEADDYPLLTLLHPVECDERELAILFDTSMKMVLNTGMEIFRRHRAWSSQYIDALNEGYAVGRKESEELLNNSVIKILRLEREAVEKDEETKKTTEALAAFETRIQELEQSLFESRQETITAREGCEAVQKENTVYQSRVEVLETEKLALSNQLAARDTAFTTLQEELETLQQDRDLAWMNAGDFFGQAEDTMEDFDDTEATLVAENESLEDENERLKVEVDSLNERLIAIQQEAVKNRDRDRLEGAKDFKSSQVFKNLVGRLACPIAFQFWENCVGQTSRAGGFKDDFNPNIHLDSGLDAEFREYGGSGDLTFEDTDEFAPLQYDEDLDQDLIPTGEPEGEPKLPNYPPKVQDPSPGEETANKPPQP